VLKHGWHNQEIEEYLSSPAEEPPVSYVLDEKEEEVPLIAPSALSSSSPSFIAPSASSAQLFRGQTKKRGTLTFLTLHI
jgi:hypothetical protein